MAPGALHSKKVEAEKDAYLAELLASLPTMNDIKDTLGAKANRLHSAFLPLYISRHYRPTTTSATQYHLAAFSHALEAESALILGLRNAGMAAMRSGVESALKFLYYELHPVEFELHGLGRHELTGFELRKFAYSIPRLANISFFSSDNVDRTWAHLCKFSHGALDAISVFSTASDIQSILKSKETEFREVLLSVKEAIKIILACFFAVNPKWLVAAEKAYFDAALEAFTNKERKEVKESLRIF